MGFVFIFWLVEHVMNHFCVLQLKLSYNKNIQGNLFKTCQKETRFKPQGKCSLGYTLIKKIRLPDSNIQKSSFSFFLECLMYKAVEVSYQCLEYNMTCKCGMSVIKLRSDTTMWTSVVPRFVPCNKFFARFVCKHVFTNGDLQQLAFTLGMSVICEILTESRPCYAEYAHSVHSVYSLNSKAKNTYCDLENNSQTSKL